MIRIMRYGETPNSEIFVRSLADADVSAAVAEIISDVRRGGDAALYAYAERYDHAKLDSLEVGRAELDAALAATEPEFLSILEKAAANIRAFHERQRRSGFVLGGEDGALVGQRVLPIERVGLCVPGGRTPLASTVLMDAIPAKLAGVPELLLVTPARPDGTVDPAILAAAQTAGVDRIFKIGGAQAVAALAYGTRSVPKADKIVGPGGAYVAEAKRQVFGAVAIDLIAGPSEVLIVADGGSDPRHVAADMLAQAEHDAMAAAVLVTDSVALAEAVRDRLEVQLALLEREETARSSIERNGKIIVADDLSAALDIANEIAPEHLELCVDEPFAWLGRVRHAGSVFLGRNCPEALGDYLAGPNHTLPTMGAARTKALEAAAKAAERLRLYSDPECRLLTKKFCEVFGFEKDEVIFTNGSDEMLNFAFMAFCDEAHPAVFPDITYGFYPVFSELNRVPYEELPLREDFTVDVDAYCGVCKTVFIANPNAPTGVALKRTEIERILRGNPDNVVVIDEAYVDFGAESCLPLVKRYDNLLVARTFSKSRSMAGARLGFGVGNPALIRDLNTIKYSTNPYNINSMTMAAGIGALDDEAYTRQNCLAIRENRAFVVDALRRMGFTVPDSLANFIFAKHARVDGETIYRELKARGVLVRHFTKPAIRDYNRITIGTLEQMRTLLDALGAILEERT